MYVTCIRARLLPSRLVLCAPGALYGGFCNVRGRGGRATVAAGSIVNGLPPRTPSMGAIATPAAMAARACQNPD